MEQAENQNRLIITIKPPTLVYSGKPKPSKTTTEEEANQLQPSECETKPPTETKPEPNHENTQELSCKTKPEVRNKTSAVPKPKQKPSQKKGIKPKLAETTDLKLFLAKKALEREKKFKGKFVVNSSSTPSPSPSNGSATLSPNNISPAQSAPRADSLNYRDITELSLSTKQGDRPSSANQGEY